MNCPICNVELAMTERQGVEIDYCPKCRGVWLDRGELDKIIEHSVSASAPAPTQSDPRRVQPNVQANYNERRYREDHDHDHDRYDDHDYKQRKRGGFLGDLFDF